MYIQQEAGFFLNMHLSFLVVWQCGGASDVLIADPQTYKFPWFCPVLWGLVIPSLEQFTIPSFGGDQLPPSSSFPDGDQAFGVIDFTLQHSVKGGVTPIENSSFLAVAGVPPCPGVGASGSLHLTHQFIFDPPSQTVSWHLPSGFPQAFVTAWPFLTKLRLRACVLRGEIPLADPISDSIALILTFAPMKLLSRILVWNWTGY